jgi:glycosyltransferase involved in cell wall biosynthesis
MRLVIVSGVVHYQSEGRLWAYGPYAREIDIWADLFSEIVIAAPCRNEKPAADSLPFTRDNITILPQMETGGSSLRAKFIQLLLLPCLIRGLWRAMRHADAVHLRCPSNLGLLGTFLAPLFSRYRVAKYAYEWNGYPGEPWTWRLQRRLLRSAYWSGLVTVYGRWPNQPPHVVSLFPALLTINDLARAGAVARNKTMSHPLRLLYAGRLSPGKNVHVLLSAVARLRAQAILVECVIVGEGSERPALEAQAAELGLMDCVSFAGGVAFKHVFDFYERADVLVLVSKAEGWPKVITEAMAFGVICIGSHWGIWRDILGEGRGLVVPPGDVDALTEAIRHIAMGPHQYDPMRHLAAVWAQQYSLEGLRDALRELLAAHWGLCSTDLAHPAKTPHVGRET